MTEQATATAPAPQSQSVPPGWITNLARKHHRLVTVVGAVIVFGTFVVKEEVRHHLNELVSAMDAAEATFKIRDQNDGLGTKIDQIANQVEALTKTHDKSDADILKVELHYAQQEQVQCFRAIDNLQDLVLKMPDDTAKELKTEVQQISDAHLALGRLAIGLEVRNAEIFPELPAIKTKSADPIADALKLREQITKLRNGIAMQAYRAQFAGLQLIREMRKAKDRTEHHYEIVTWASYILYAFGWGLGLVGRLIGVNAGGED